MRGSKRTIGAVFVAVLCAGLVPRAGAAEKEPVTGGMVSAPIIESPMVPIPGQSWRPPSGASRSGTISHGPCRRNRGAGESSRAGAAPPPARKAREDDDTSWGFVARAGISASRMRSPTSSSVSTPRSGHHLWRRGALPRLRRRAGGVEHRAGVDAASAKADASGMADESTRPRPRRRDRDARDHGTGYWSIFPSW